VSAALHAAQDQLGIEVTFIADAAGAPSNHVSGDSDVYVRLELCDGVIGSLRCRAGGDQEARSLRMLSQLIRRHLEERRRDDARRRSDIRSAGVQALLAALAARDRYTKEHSEAVVKLSDATARALRLPTAPRDEINQVALLHDLGKIAIPDPILRKRGPLSEEEWKSMREHTIVGARIVASVDGLGHLAPAIRAAHERWDGHGYPDGLAGEEIPLASRIVSLCDAFHAMVSPRPYRAALHPRRAAIEIARGAGSQFCPRSAAALLAAS
jgi:HD-GYP domain-containing protein (c-di-GMP phosphodiesterase class II)